MTNSTPAFADNLIDQIIGHFFKRYTCLIVTCRFRTQGLDTGLAVSDFILTDKNGKRGTAFIGTFHLCLETASGICR